MSIHAFGAFVLDESSRRLLRGDGTPLDLPGRAFDVLAALLRQRGRLVTRAELLDTVWQDADVTDAALSQTLSLIRRALGPDGHDLIRTVPGRGYCIDLPPAAVVAPLTARAAPVADALIVDPAADNPAASAVPPAVGRRVARRTLWLGLGLGLCAVVAVWLGQRFLAAPGPPAAPAALTISLRMAPGAPARDGWTVSALYGVLRTGLHGNFDVLVSDSDAAAARPRLTGVIRMERAGVPRRVAVTWTLESADGGRQCWRDGAPADRLFDLATRAQTRLHAYEPALSLTGMRQTTGPVPESALMLFARGIDEKAEHRAADAARYFEAALQAYPDLTIARIELANTLLDQGYRAAAASHLRRVDQALAARSDADSIALRARSLFLARDFAAAAEAYRPLVAAHPDILQWRLNGAQAYALAGSGPPALALLAPIDPQALSARWAVEYHKMRAIALMASGEPAEAIAAGRAQLQDALRLREPELEAEAHLNLARLFYRSEDMAAATEAATRSLVAAERGRSSRTAFEARQFHVGLRMLDEQPVAPRELAALLEAARSTGDVYREGAVELTLANSRFQQLDLERAVAHRQRALRLLERSGDRNGIDTALQSLFGLERLRGDRDAARVWLHRLEAGAEDSPLERWQVDFERGRGTIWSGQPAQAIVELQDARQALGDAVSPMGRAALACLQGQAAVLAGDAVAALAALDDCDAAIPGAATPAGAGVEQDILRARAQVWRAIAAHAAGRPADAARAMRAAETRVRTMGGYRTMEVLGELALATAIVDQPVHARSALAWIARRPEVRAAALPRAMLERAQCTLARREGDAAAGVCIEADAAAERIGHPVLGLGAAR